MAKAEDRGTAAAEATPLPSRVEDIPGVGPIRARCLKKAGWDSVEALRRASAAELGAVPGITQVKAQQIVEYVGTLPGGRVEVAEPLAASPEPMGEPAGVGPVAAVVRQRTPLQNAALRVAGTAGWLLQSPQAERLGRKLVGQLSKVVSLAGRMSETPLPESADGERASRLLARMASALDLLTAETKPGAARQQKVAGSLRRRRRKLARLLSRQPEP